jgi:hypothetical protein
MSTLPTHPIQLLALDMDGTVLNDRKEISPRTLAALTAAARQGVHIVPATGRTANGIPDALLAIPGVRYAITANGARVMDLAENKCLYEAYIPRDTALAAYDILKKYDCLVDIFQDGQGYTCRENLDRAPEFIPENLLAYVTGTRECLPDLRAFIDSQTKGLEKFTLFFRDEAERQRAWREMEQLDLTVVSSLERNMEMNATGVNKGQGLRALGEILHLPTEALMACGDGGNDLEMLRAAGFGVAMENAFPAVKAAADYVTASNNDDGVARAVERFVLHTSPAAFAQKPDIRMVALDLDGTVLDSHSVITPRTAAAISAAIAKGVVVLPATGRGLCGLPVQFAGLPGVRYAVTTNGASVWDMGPDPVGAVYSRYADPMGHTVSQPTCLLCTMLPADTARTVFEILRPYPGCLQLFSDGQSVRSEADNAWSRANMQRSLSTELRQAIDARFVAVPDLRVWLGDHPDRVEKFCQFFADQTDLQAARAALAAVPGIEIVQGAPDNLEVTAAGVDKGEALLALGRLLGIERAQILAVGDSDNDRAMLQKAGIAVAMANAMPQIKALADLVTCSDHDHDGVGELLEQLVL